jgi:hypothetical protein
LWVSRRRPARSYFCLSIFEKALASREAERVPCLPMSSPTVHMLTWGSLMAIPLFYSLARHDHKSKSSL